MSGCHQAVGTYRIFFIYLYISGCHKADEPSAAAQEGAHHQRDYCHEVKQTSQRGKTQKETTKLQKNVFSTLSTYRSSEHLFLINDYLLFTITLLLSYTLICRDMRQYFSSFLIIIICKKFSIGILFARSTSWTPSW